MQYQSHYADLLGFLQHAISSQGLTKGFGNLKRGERWVDGVSIYCKQLHAEFSTTLIYPEIMVIYQMG